MIRKSLITDVIFAFVTISVIVLFIGYGTGSFFSESEVEPAGSSGTLKILGVDAYPEAAVEKIFLSITEIKVQSLEKEWRTLTQTPGKTDFLTLLRGDTGRIASGKLPSGHYTRIRMILSAESETVIRGVRYPLVSPDGNYIEVYADIDLTIEDNKIHELLVSFETARSIFPSPPVYKLRPAVRIFDRARCGTVSGTVTDNDGIPLAGVRIQAIDSGDNTFSTLSDSRGRFSLILPEDTYTLNSSGEEFTEIDSSPRTLVVTGGGNIADCRFKLSFCRI